MKVLRNFDEFVKRNKINENRFEEGDEKELDRGFGGDDFDDEDRFGDMDDDDDFGDFDDDDDFDDMDDDDMDDDDMDDDDMDDDDDFGDFDEDDDFDDMDDEDMDDDDEDMENIEGMEGEEEEGEYKGTLMMRELADLLDTEVSDSNEIEYNGHKINFYSETEKFHIGKKTFETPEEVVEYVESSDVTEDSVKNERYSPKNRRRR